MRIAVLEAVCAGMCGDDPSPSLLAEGLAMWRAVVDDLLVIPGVSVETVINDQWFSMLPPLPQFHARRTTDVVETMRCWESCLEDTDAAWIIAPECDGLLQRLVESLPSRHRTFNAAPEAIQLCADKLALAQHLEQHGIATIPTIAETWTVSLDDLKRGFVIKPRDGAGSQLVRFVDEPASWERTRREFRLQNDVQAVRQPYVNGVPLSIAGWFHAGGVQWFPVAEQVLGEEFERFMYCGGVIPAELSRPAQRVVQRLAASAAATIPGLQGYIGFDIVFPLTTAFMEPRLVEINPRLTTSCLGIRKLCRANWLRLLIANPKRPLIWHTDRRIHFTATGDVREERLS
ncbi:MAG: ATP-grasp domain-containing protein [Planctomycetaceae bacterium]|nr:ATP-grasp domain-containing protein [Planctomycetaceae bacterium]